jgi:hypothetical protein
MAALVRASKPLIQLFISGARSDEPAPFSSAEAAAVEIEAMHPTIPIVAMKKPTNLLRIKSESFRLVIVIRLPEGVARPLADSRMPWRVGGGVTIV